MVSNPFWILSNEKLVASLGDRIRISKFVVSKSSKYLFTFLIICLSCERSLSSQKTAGFLVALALETASFTQSLIGASFT